MKPELREVLGKAVYEVSRRGHRQDRVLHPDILPTELPAWEEIAPLWQELNRERGEAAVQALMQDLASIRLELFSWAGLHRGKALAEEAMPRFHEIIDAFEQLLIGKKEAE